MATASQPNRLEEGEPAEVYEFPDGHRLPGRTVDALLQEGKTDEARLEWRG